MYKFMPTINGYPYQLPYWINPSYQIDNPMGFDLYRTKDGRLFLPTGAYPGLLNNMCSFLRCGPNSQPGGPVGATYSLYGNPADLNKAFNVNSAARLPCPGTTDPGPTPWQGGMVKCGSPYPHLGGVMLTWTTDADLLMANVNSSDLASLYAWWLAAR